jgi:hypothetical protein
MSNPTAPKIELRFDPVHVESDPGEMRFFFKAPADLARHLKIKRDVGLVLHTVPDGDPSENGGFIAVFCTEMNNAPPLSKGSSYNASRCSVFSREDWPTVLACAVVDPGRTAFAYLVSLLSTDVRAAA